jgi:hypothetical protein
MYQHSKDEDLFCLIEQVMAQSKKRTLYQARFVKIEVLFVYTFSILPSNSITGEIGVAVPSY